MTSLLDSALLAAQSTDWLKVLLDVSVKGTIILAVAGLLGIALRRTSAAARHLTWSLALGSLLALPILALVLPAWQVSMLPRLSPTPPAKTAPVPPIQAEAGAADPFPDALPPAGKQPNGSQPMPAAVDAWSVAPGIPTLPLLVKLPSDTVGIKRESANSLFTLLPWPTTLLLVWLAGVFLVLVRLLFGTASVWRVAKQARQITESSWTALARRLASQLRLKGPVTLLKSERVAMPMTWGSLRSVVVLPADADQWSDGCRNIVLLHELAHVKRRDCLTQTLAQVACALYWFNPLVWAAARQLRVERELACDDHVLGAGTRATDYASYLVEVAISLGMPQCPSPVTVGMACSQLESRVRAILDPSVRRRGLNRMATTLLVLSGACLVLPLAAIRPGTKAAALTRAESAGIVATPAPGGSVDLPLAQDSKPEVDERQSEPSVAETGSPGDSGSREKNSAATPQSEGTPLEVAAEQTAREIPSTVARQAEARNLAALIAGQGEGSGQGTGQGSGQGSGRGEGQGSSLSADQIIQLRMAGVTPEYIEAMRKLGYDNLSARQLANMRLHGVTEQFIKEAQDWGYGKLSVNDLVSMKIAGVTPDYVRAMKQAGFDNLTVSKLTQMRLHGVTPEFVEEMRKLGYSNLSADTLTQMKIHGITPEFVRQSQDWGYGKLSVNQMVQIKISGVTPEYAQAMKRLGLENLSLNQLTSMRLHGVTPEFIEEVRRQGFDNLSADTLAQMRIHGITPEFIREAQNWGYGKLSVNQMVQIKISGLTPDYVRSLKGLGFDNLSLNKLTQMRLHGVTPEYVKEMRELGFDNLTVDQLIQMRIHGVTADYVKKMRAAGVKNISVNQMIRLKAQGVDTILFKD